MATQFIVAINAQTNRIRIMNPKNSTEHIPCRYVGILEEEILPLIEDFIRPHLIEGIQPAQNFIAPLMNGAPIGADRSWDLVGKIRLDTDRMFKRDSKYIALYHEFSGVPNDDFDPAFPRAYFLSTAIYYDLLHERKPYLLATEAYIDPQVPELEDINPNQDLRGFLRDFARRSNKSKRLDMTVHGQLVSYEKGALVGKNFDMTFKTDKDGFARTGWKKVLTHASKHIEKYNRQEFIGAFMALASAIEIYDETLEVAKDFKTITGTRLCSQNVLPSFIKSRAEEWQRH